MEGNRDEALRCLSIAQRHRNAGNYTSARKFIQKSLTLFATPEAEKLAQIIESEASASASTSTSEGAEETTRATGREQHPSAGGSHHRHPNGNASRSRPTEGSSSESEKKRDYTPDQLAVVKRVRACKITEYYQILELKKDCEEADVKKAYRKVRNFCVSAVLESRLLIWDVLNSSRWLYTLIRTALRVLTRLSRVRFFSV
jgi:DnaJ homolog subfamily B member 12